MSSVTETFASTAESTASATATASASAEEEFIKNIPKISLKTPLLYLGILIFTLILFSIYHRRTKFNKLQKLTTSSLFLTDLELPQDKQSEIENFTPTVDSISSILYTDLKNLESHEKMIKIALIQRCAESLRRIIKLKEIEQSIMILYTRGLIGDDSFKRFKLQSKLQELEMLEISKEAEGIKPGWSRTLFANSQEVMMNQALRRRISAINDRISGVNNLEIKGIESIVTDLQNRIDVLKKA